jgi:hypothetical protein
VVGAVSCYADAGSARRLLMRNTLLQGERPARDGNSSRGGGSQK